ncbi:MULTISPECIES: STAS-like domain-containing protein [Dorea]|jgi:hypothetical protein|uniref:STAS-like domain-containing protein n=1 Tax=Dorea TaxID=189330 RepID=UPI001D00209F|nr:DUF4325 domain-containing protein [Dorea formicigenerans]MCB5502929.1 DUF4325 domain-containing protein [Dorea formicigenerans]
MKKLYLNWNNKNTLRQFIEQMEYCKSSSEKEVNIVAPDRMRTYPDICAPLSALIDEYKDRGYKFTFNFPGKNNYVEHTCISKPLQVEKMINSNSSELAFPLDKIWKYNSAEGVGKLVTAYVQAIRTNTVLETGVISSVEWCLNEVMDNVLQHSMSGVGYVMGQMHKEKKRISICVADSGIGIYGSLKKSKHCPRNAIDGLTMALQEKVTRDEHVGQGNGLWGLGKIVAENGGTLEIQSNSANLLYKEGDTKTKETDEFNIGKYNNLTYVDFQMDYSHQTDVSKALNGYKPLDMWLEEHETDDYLYFSLQEDCVGTGTRIAAQKFKNQIFNAWNEEKKKVVLDFTGINVVSSSFADELIGKIVAEKGFIYFSHYFEIRNLSEFNMSVINRSVEQRMAQKYYDEIITDKEEKE